MTNKCFTREEFKLLNKNLNFCPRPSYFNKQKLNSDLLQFYRRIKLKSFFGNKPRINIENQNQFKTKRKSNWIPSKCHHTVDTFIAAINKELQETNIKKPPTDNLSSKERKALNELKVRDDIIITNADKGGAVVILDSNDYLKEAERQLSDQQSYLKLNEEPTVSHTQKVKETLKELTEKKFLEKKRRFPQNFQELAEVLACICSQISHQTTSMTQIAAAPVAQTDLDYQKRRKLMKTSNKTICQIHL